MLVSNSATKPEGCRDLIVVGFAYLDTTSTPNRFLNPEQSIRPFYGNPP